MHRLLKLGAAIGVSLIFAAPLPKCAAAPPEILPSTELSVGMSGVGYTVIDPSGDIRPFNVDVVGILDSGKAATRRILANAHGSLIEDTGAILSGMSGSPVYVDGKLIGALSASYQGMGESTFLITPIEEMLKIWQMPDKKNKSHLKTIDIKKLQEEKEKKKEEEKQKAEKKVKDQTVKSDSSEKTADGKENALVAIAKKFSASLFKKKEPVTERNLVMATGFDEDGLSFLREKLEPFHAKPLQLTAGGVAVLGTDYNAYVEPGSPIGAALAYGDFSLVATGTVTAVDDKKVLAFGHSFLHNGNVNYLMTDATVVGTVSGRGDGMRFANVGKIIGRFSQDRNAGLAGEVGVFPDVVPVKVKVQDTGLATEENFDTRIAYDEDLLPQIGAAMVYASLSKVSDTKGESTVTVDFTVRTNAVAEGKIERRNMFYGVSDVGKVAVQELTQILTTICTNTEKESDIIDVQVNIKVEPERKTATLISAVPEKNKVKPGETVNFTTTIKPYRQEKETLTIPFKVPQNQREGLMALDIKGGGLVALTPLALVQQSGIAVVSEEEKTMSTADKLKKLLKTDKNNEIIIAPSLIVNDKGKNASGESLPGSAAPVHKVELLGKGKKAAAQENRLATNYVIDNVIHASLQIEK